MGENRSICRNLGWLRSDIDAARLDLVRTGFQINGCNGMRNAVYARAAAYSFGGIKSWIGFPLSILFSGLQPDSAGFGRKEMSRK